MGRIITISPKLAVPTQLTLQKSKFKYILRSFNKIGNSVLDYVPVREHEGKYYILDGHHRMAIAFLADIRIKTFVPENENDLMRKSIFPELQEDYLESMNHNIGYRFDDVVDWANDSSLMEGIKDLGDLVRNQALLQSLDKVWEEVLDAPFPSQYLLSQVKAC